MPTERDAADFLTRARADYERAILAADGTIGTFDRDVLAALGRRAGPAAMIEAAAEVVRDAQALAAAAPR